MQVCRYFSNIFAKLTMPILFLLPPFVTLSIRNESSAADNEIQTKKVNRRFHSNRKPGWI